MPTPASPTIATTRPSPPAAASSAARRAARSVSRPTKGESPRVAAASARDRAVAAPVTSCTSTGAWRPRTGMRPSERVATRPPLRATVSAVARMEPGLAICSMRAARCTVGPTAV